MKLTIEQRVANGARWLDENFPGWEKRINIKTLDLSYGEDCICGQVFKRKAREYASGFDYAYSTLFEEANSWITELVPEEQYSRATQVAYVLGFTTGYPSSSVQWKNLQKAWVDLLTKRKELVNA